MNISRIMTLKFLLFFYTILWVTIFSSEASKVRDQILNTGILTDSEDDILLISTLDGSLHAVTKNTGTKKWTLKEEAVIQNPSDSDHSNHPRFFPNPQDGTLYRYTLGRGREPLKKLPFTIPELVANSPCRSTEGIFYLGKKVDTWLGIDSVTGKKQLILGADSVERMCPKPSSHTVYLGRTLYNIVLFEPNTGHKWNVSFYHYSANNSTPNDNYELVHYTATGEGSILTIEKESGSLLWSLDLQSPVIAIYHLNADGTLSTIHMTAVAPQTLEHFTYDLTHHSQFYHSSGSDALRIKKLSPTIYLGETDGGVYALPALVDEETITISRKESQLLLEGPPGRQATMNTGSKDEENEKQNSGLIVLGYYDLPESLKSDLSKLSSKEIEGLGFSDGPLGITSQNNKSSINYGTASIGTQTEEFELSVLYGWHELLSGNINFIFSSDGFKWMFNILYLFITWPFSQPINLIVFILIILLTIIGVILYKQAQDYARLHQEMSSQRLGSRSSLENSSGEITAIAEEMDTGHIKVGKMMFDPNAILGKGCDGTFVFKGTFDERSIAVKRVLPGCFSIADREVDLLRESDQHPHVIRYFCTEQCREFRYIALELCAATLDDFVLEKFVANISPIAVLRQATSGLQHLHSLDIVHRDIKPHNVLLSFPNSKGEVRAMISDFGLCRRLESGRMSFSKKSGITGTEGWIAPEMMNSDRPTTKVDIFSLGCVYYFVLSKGRHPFGSTLERQSNIMAGSYDLSFLDRSKDILPFSLLEKMIHAKPSERPPTQALMRHPLFWTNDNILQFFQDVSDRIEKESNTSGLIMNLEWGATNVVRGDWQQHMHPCIAEDLRKFREYKGRSVRDLLRALRNKKNHYRELSEEARNVFGRIPDEFVPYWTKRFPRLLLHTWTVMQTCKTEPVFNKYYFSNFSFKNAGHSSSDEDKNSNHFEHQIILAPNNISPIKSILSEDENAAVVLTKNKTEVENADNFSEANIVDRLLGPPLAKGRRKHAKHDTNSSPVWITKKVVNTFEPDFQKIQATPDAKDRKVEHTFKKHEKKKKGLNS